MIGPMNVQSSNRPRRRRTAHKEKRPAISGAPGDEDQSFLLRVQIRLCAPSSPSTRRA
jgi:hypothetical protein